MRDRELRRYCKRLLRDLDIRPPLRVDDLCRRLSERRARPIWAVPRMLSVPGPFGLWIALEHKDLILYQAETTRVHQDHIILHEIGHILADHQHDGLSAEDDPSSDPGSTDPPDLRQFRRFRRTCYDEEFEREAEMVATIIREWAVIIDYMAPSAAENAELEPLGSALNPRWGWH